MAGSFKLFQFVLKSYQTIGIFKPVPNEHHLLNARCVFLIIYSVHLFILMVLSTVFESQSISELSLGFYFITTLTFIMFFYISMIFFFANAYELIEKFQKFIEARLHDCISRTMYTMVNERIENTSMLVSSIVINSIPLGFLSPILSTIYNYYILDLDKDSFIMPCPMILSSIWKTPLGYILFTLDIIFGDILSTSLILPTICFVLGSGWIFKSFIEDISRELRYLIVDDESNGNEDDEPIATRFCNIVKLYTSVKELVEEFNEIVEFLFFGFFLWGFVNVSTMLLVLQSQLTSTDSNPQEMVLTTQIVVAVFIGIFIACELNERVTDKFEIFNEKLWKCNWYLFPMGLQRMYLIFGSNTQQPVYIRAYGNILCTRETYKKVMKSGFSYFMTLRNFN